MRQNRGKGPLLIIGCLHWTALRLEGQACGRWVVLRELRMTRAALHLAQRVMKFLAVAYDAGLDLGTQPGKRAWLLQIRIEQLNRLCCDLGGQSTASFFHLLAADLIARRFAPFAYRYMAQDRAGNSLVDCFGVFRCLRLIAGQFGCFVPGEQLGNEVFSPLLISLE